MSDGYGRSAASPITREQTVRLIVRTCLEEGVTDERQIAYVLATAEHESQNFTSPEESSGRKQAAEIGYRGGERAGYGSGEEYFGRGYAHLTHWENYRDLGETLGRGNELLDNPSLAADPEVASRVLVVGMRDGHFTGRRLDDYVTADRTDYANARRIVNGTDRAADVAALARAWEPSVGDLVIAVRRDGVDLTPLEEARRADTPLQRGDANARVFELQQYLAALNITDAAGRRLSPDGDFGRSTDQAVRSYQRTAGVPTTGTVDPAIFDRIRGDALRTNPDFRLKTMMDLHGPLKDGVLGPGDRGDSVAELQEQLQGLGFRGGNGRPLNISRSYDNATQQAVRRFQDDAGIAPANGLADERTRDAINADAVERGLQEATEVVRRRELQRAQQPQQEQGRQADGRQGMLYEPPGRLDESLTDRYLAAVMSGDSASADRAAIEFARSAEGRHMGVQGEQWLAQQQAAEQTQAQDRQMAR
ncbi:peptidoglycan-binding protein [Pseudoxanthomonas sp. PXM02]|uniref:peptidoglycan-binding domain-containing protein n=1 Tax=Pseudoxanthomonas sp. PXM02 TaxID=2769294 RepID=UPI001784A09D|nr:peptidoglycan-binding protein [Pseudoxanthomonas sp. PXM02]MBD9478394.1 peptidoglycan-binding protein [Pseudoxanthomonas sp. PXM02]